MINVTETDMGILVAAESPAEALTTNLVIDTPAGDSAATKCKLFSWSTFKEYR